MLPIEIFYHLYIPADWRCCLWAQYLDGHMQLLKRTNLYPISQVNLAISMPMHWTEVQGYPLIGNQTKKPVTFYEKVTEYINLRYPEIQIIDSRDVGQHNLYEGQTLKLLWEKSLVADRIFLYIHTKGISNYSPVATTDNWRQILDHFIIENWANNIKNLAHNDVVGIKDKISADFVLSGNYWWSKTSYLCRLPDPLDTGFYYKHPETPQRYAYERWITANNPRLSYAVDTHTDHYQDYCFVENLVS